MTDASDTHGYNAGDTVLANINGAMIPGVVEGKEGDRFLVRLSTPWTDETGQSSDEAWLTSDKLDPSVGQGTGGTQALPS